jgi:hypothetical protein
MRRLLAVLVPLALLVACGDDAADDAPTTVVGDAAVESPTEEPDDTGDEETGTPSEGAPSETTAPEDTIPTDSPAGDAPDGGAQDEGLGDALLVSDLDGAAEVPGPGHPSASGRFEGELNDGVLCVDMEVSGLATPVTGAHLHDGAAGEAGDVIVDIGEPTSADGDPVRWTDVCTEVGDDVIERIAAAPEQVYVNVHTPDLPAGAVRGQLAVASVFDRTLDG